VTYFGAFNFSDYSGSWPNDDDTNSTVDGAAGLTAGNVREKTDSGSEIYPYGGFLGEYDESEVGPHFQTQWWQTYDFLITNGGSSKTPLDQMSPPGTAVVTGLIGMDGVHAPVLTELHPVFAVAIPIDSPDNAPANEEVWEFFIRNQGDEGSCSDQIHTWEPEIAGGQDYFITLPWPANVSSAASTKVTAKFNAQPWVTGATLGPLQYTPGVGIYLDFKAPAYGSGEAVPFFGFDGNVTLDFDTGDQNKAPAAPKKINREVSRATAAPPEKDGDDEEFPWRKLQDIPTDPGVKTHLQKFFAQPKSPVKAIPGGALIARTDSGTSVKAKALDTKAALPSRTKTLVSVVKDRHLNDLAAAEGFPRRTFQAIDAQHLFALGTDGVLRYKQVPNAAAGAVVTIAEGDGVTVDRNVVSFEAVSATEVWVLKSTGKVLGGHAALFDETAPFGTIATGTCLQGYVWRQAYTDGSRTDHVCVTPAVRTQAAADDAAAASRLAKDGFCNKGYVWREADQQDHVCVTPEVRAQTAQDNRLGPERVSGPTASKAVVWPVAAFRATTPGKALVSDPDGGLWVATAGSKPLKIASDVRAFQPSNGSLDLVISGSDVLTSIDSSGARIQNPRAISGIWAFQQVADGTLFTIHNDDTLWNENTGKSINQEIQSLQALDVNTVFVLRYGGALALSLPNSALLSDKIGIPIDTGVRAFQALDSKTVFTLDETGRVWKQQLPAGAGVPTKALVAIGVR
jgi:hypothetical protein